MTRGERQEGIVLVLTMIVIAVLMMLILAFTSSARVERSSADRALNEIQAREAARSAILHGVLYLAEDARKDEARGHRYDARGERWTFPQELTINDAKVLITIEDEHRRFNLYNLVHGSRPSSKSRRRVQFRRLLDALQEQSADVPDMDTDKLVDNLVEYVFDTRGVPLRTKDEILLVDGYDGDLYYGRSGHDGTDKKPRGLRELVTLFPTRGSAHRINVNTAPVEVLMAVSPFMTRAVAEGIVFERQDGDSPYLSLGNLRERLAVMNETLAPGRTRYDELAAYLTTTSTYFTVTGEARYESVISRIRALVRRTGEDVTIVWAEAVTDKQFLTEADTQAAGHGSRQSERR